MLENYLHYSFKHLRKGKERNCISSITTVTFTEMSPKPKMSILVALLAFFTTTIKAETTLSHVKATYNRFNNRISNVDATYYGEQGGKGKCTLNPLSPNILNAIRKKNWIVVAAAPGTYQESVGCGMCVQITGTGEGSGANPITGKRRAMIVDICPGGCGNNGLDFAISGDGRWKIHYQAIDCPTLRGINGKIQFRFQGSNPYYIKLQARNTKIPTAGMELLINGRYHCMKRVSDNFFIASGLGKMETPLSVRLTAINGYQVTTRIPEIKNDFDFPSKVQFKGIKRGPGPDGIKCFGQGDRPPYPSGGMQP